MNIQEFNRKETSSVEDGIEQVLLRSARWLLLGSLGLLPLLFFPISYAPLEYTKTFIVLVAVTLALLLFCLSCLRAGSITLRFPLPLIAFTLVALVSLLSALLSGDRYDAFIGDTFNVQTAFFLFLIRTVAVAAFLLLTTKALVLRLYVLLMASGLGLAVLFLARLISPNSLFNLGVLSGPTDNLLGGLNDLALFFGLVTLLSLVALTQLALTKSGRIFFLFMIAIALLILAIVNFFIIWLVLGLVSMVLLVYSLTRKHFTNSFLNPTAATAETSVAAPLLASTLVFVTALVFVIGGAMVGGMVSRLTDINYIEVRPSLQATYDIARAVYQEDAILGIGPNRFVDAWRLYKDPAINQTDFWAVDFPNGNGYLTTQFVTTGALGLFAWVFFLGTFIWLGLRALLQNSPRDKVWYFITTSSFIGASFLWGLSFIYTPGTVMLILAALLTGLTVGGSAQIYRLPSYRLAVEQNRQLGLVLVSLVMIVMVVAITVLYYAGRHYTANLMYQGAISNGGQPATLEEVELTIANAYALVSSDTYARQLALYQIAKMNSLLASTEPSSIEQQAFNKATRTGISAAKEAIAADPTNPVNYTTNAAILSLMVSVGVKEAFEPAEQLFETAQSFDPNNPSYLLLRAQLASRAGDTTKARSLLEEAVKTKSNYSEALVALSQLDIAEGRVDDAITRTEAVLALEPTNPARYYQLGVLLSSAKKNPEALTAFEQAIALDPGYANARYLLALGYLDAGRKAEAIAQLQTIVDLNPGNAFVSDLITNLKSGQSPKVATSTESVSAEPETEDIISNETGTVITDEAPDTPLVTPVNAAPDQSNQ